MPIGPEEGCPTNAPSSVDIIGDVAEIALSAETVWREYSGGEKTNEKVHSTHRIKK